MPFNQARRKATRISNSPFVTTSGIAQNETVITVKHPRQVGPVEKKLRRLANCRGNGEQTPRFAVLMEKILLVGNHGGFQQMHNLIGDYSGQKFELPLLYSDSYYL